jgi:hypothetical protein
MLVSAVEVRFPELIVEARERVEALNDPDALNRLFLALLSASDAVEACRMLVEPNYHNNGR